jgi:predicted nuclease of predicted toxin-antitoxin system
MNFLIDECLLTSLVSVAHDAGHICDHVNFLGLGGYKDWQLMRKIRTEEYTFVTNNRTYFKALYDQEELHAGLIVIIPSVTPALQRQLFSTALSHIGRRDLTNSVLEVDLRGATVVCREFELPSR